MTRISVWRGAGVLRKNLRDEALGVVGCRRIYGEKGRNMLNTDRVLWERELAEHMSQYGTDILDLPPVAPEPPTRARRWLMRLMLWTPVALVGGTVGWSVGWYVI